MEKEFKSNGLFWHLVIKLKDREVLFFKNAEEEPFYYFSYDEWLNDETWMQYQMNDKTWFTNEMFIFINSQIVKP